MSEGTPTAAEGRGFVSEGSSMLHPAVEISRRARLEVLGAIMLALLLGALDQTIVGVALPRIVTDLQGNDLYTWAVTIYLLTSTVTVPFYGKLSDLYGRRPLLIIGITIFLAGSALSGLSQEMWQLILFRGIQGIGAGALFPIALAVIGDLFTPAERGKYQGLFGAVFGLSALVGPALGGFITDNLSWHWIFYVNLPVGIVSLAVIFRVLPTVRREGVRYRLDYLGAAVFTAAISPLLVGLTNASGGNWTDFWVGGLILIGLVLFAAFLLIERRAAEPIIPLDLFSNRTYAASIAATFFASFGFFAAIVFLPLYFQVVLGESATTSGYAMFPLLIGVIGGSVIAGQIVARTGKYKALILAALVLLAVGSFLLTGLRSETNVWFLNGAMLVGGLGIGPTLAVFTIVIQNAVPFHKLGVATSSLTFFRQIGGSVGLAVAGSYFASQLQTNIPAQMSAAGVPAQFAQQFAGGSFNRDSLGAGVDLAATLTAAGVPTDVVGTLVKAIYEAMSVSIGAVFWLGVAAAVLAFVASLLMRELPLRSGRHPAGARGGKDSDGRVATPRLSEAAATIE